MYFVLPGATERSILDVAAVLDPPLELYGLSTFVIYLQFLK